MKDIKLNERELGSVIGGYNPMNPESNRILNALNKKNEEDYNRDLAEFNRRLDNYRFEHGGKDPIRTGIVVDYKAVLGMDEPRKPLILVG